jgi:hypothetical protein
MEDVGGDGVKGPGSAPALDDLFFAAITTVDRLFVQQ